MKEPPEDFLVGIVNSEPAFGMGGKLILMLLILLIAVGIIWWVRKK